MSPLLTLPPPAQRLHAGRPACTFLPGHTLLVLDSPHSGTLYPDDFRPACPLAALRAAEDTDVDALWSFAPALGVTWLAAHFPRSYIDANRSLSDIDLSMIEGPWLGPVMPGPQMRLGKGLLWRQLDDGTPLYDRPLSAAEAQARIDRCWRPYHRLLDEAVGQAHRRHGAVIHLNCYSMSSVDRAWSTEHPGPSQADFVLGDRDGSTADPRLTRRIERFLQSRGFTVCVNPPGKGVEIVRRQGRPQVRRHSIQLEINKCLYLDEKSLTRLPQFNRMQNLLRELALMLLGMDRITL